MKAHDKFLLLVLGSLFLATPSSSQEKVLKAAVNRYGVQRVELIGGSYYFFPNHMIVKVNVPVELVARKERGMVPHDIAINSPEAGIVFQESLEKKPKVIRFTPRKTGKYTFYCSRKLLFFESHREKGMEGVLEVTE